MIKHYFNLALWSALGLIVAAVPIHAQQFGQFGGGNRGGGGGGGARGGTSSGGIGSYYPNNRVGEAIVSSDPDSRRLIVITDEETSQYVGQVITNLDKPKPQVLINVIFLEATYNNNFDLGVESTYGHRIDGNTTVGLTNSFGNLLGQGAANAFGTPGAGLYSIAGKDFSVTLRAIQANGSLEVLSRPTILARNNQQAYILVGQRVPLITSVTYSALNNLPINSISYTDVGIKLAVTPFITSEDYVEMIVSPEISSLDLSQTVQVSQGVNAPVINTRSADTVVVTPNGQSVVIGGLMQNSKNTTDSRIPLLGDIPGLGNLFKRKQKGGTKTELIIFLTPHIVRTPGELRGVSDNEAVHAENAANAFPEQELNRFVDGIPLKQNPPSDKKKKH
jgi:general secretion pathway protein D